MMTAAKELFQKRLKALRAEKNYYNRFIFNGHFSVFLLILFGAFILGYGQWLKHVPKDVNYALIIGIVLSITSLFPLKTLLKDADRLFLLPFEKQMRVYIKESIQYSYLARLPLQIILLIIAYPLVHTVYPDRMHAFILVVLMAFMFPLLGLVIKWQWYRYQLENWSVQFILFLIYLSGYYLILGPFDIKGVGSIVILLALIWLFNRLNQKSHFPWEFMIKQAHQHQINYYKFVNMFTDVKGIQEQAVRRRYLDFLLKKPKPFNDKQMYPFLFKRNFLRGRDAFNLTLRLVIIAIALMIWLSHPIVSAIIGSLSMYIIVLQMSQFYKQEAYSLWPQVWPVSEMHVIVGYRKFLQHTVLVIGIILSIVYIILNISYFYLFILFFIVGYLTVNATIKKLKYQESLLKD